MNHYVLDNVNLWIGDGNAYHGHLVVAGDRIESVSPGPYDGPLPATDMERTNLSPGMVDLMLLGGFGKSIMRDDPLDIARECVRLGVTAIQFASGTLNWEAYTRIAENVRQAMKHDRPDAARVLGWYPEGPFQHPEMTGASLREYALPPTPENMQRILDEMGDIFRMINVSPGTEDDLNAIRTFGAAGKVVSMAHANASAEHTLDCVAAGTSVLGHFHCNNRGRLDEIGRGLPSIDEVGLTDDRVRFVHLICDGVHVHPMLVRLVLRCRGVEAICLVTDAHPSTGCADGPFTWDDGRTFIKTGPVARMEDGRLVGSAMMSPDHFRNFIKFTGLPPQEALRTVTHNPAVSIGLGDELGLLSPGHMADLAAWDDSLNLHRVWRAGQEITNVSTLAEVQL